jgi:multiple sugar transport system substrate-binding protein
MTLGKFGTAHQLYIPWMLASYIMVADKKALPYVPDGADINALSYDQLAAWASAVREKTGKRLLGFPAGPQGLMHRFFEGFLYPSYTGGVVVPFRSEAAETMWTHFASLWKSVNPNSASYNFMQEPLLSGDVWIAFDHIARVLDALRQKPDEFVAFPAPAGPKGRGYMPALAGLAVVKGAPDVNGAMALIDYLEQPETQIATTRSVGFFPVAKVDLPPAWPQARRQRDRKDAIGERCAAGGAADRPWPARRRVRQSTHGNVPAHCAARPEASGCARPRSGDAEAPNDRDRRAVLATRSAQH